ncbi:sigma-70 family RNA polymerase sigma factor [Cytophagaceae bacterium DM2B3-1]|uniref:Sigma-70 family RNA polymerase sigma factor n=1 Tax=Xanthocytophaga flava TaxID=3048013 RepID=A0ABT7CIB6_9BACT|nr:sigma-70 family RNA polymerase sigma factor [Xanthocytophaga flavus]MDJ1493281.1 sigma-70 family RNA polymerase sigma factor [Xanthocytophaga flavus]
MKAYQEIYSIITAYIHKLTSDKNIIDEVTQEVLIKVHQSIQTLQHEDKLTSWLKRIVYTTLMDYYRREQSLLTQEIGELVSMEEYSNEGNEEVLQCIQLLIDILPEEERQLMIAVEIEGVKQTDYAKKHQLPLSTVKSRIQRARQKLKDTIKGNCFLTNDVYGNVVDYKKPSFVGSEKII